MPVPMPLAAAGTFINTEQTFIAAAFHQNWLMNVQPGNDAEFVRNPYPGRHFKGKVRDIIPATGEGQYDPSKSIPLAFQVVSLGKTDLRVKFTASPRKVRFSILSR